MSFNNVLQLLCINGIAVAVFFVYTCIIKKEYKKNWIKIIFMLAVPGLGCLYLACVQLVNRILFRTPKKIKDEDLSFSKKRTQMIISDDVEKEADLVPIEEVMRISDTLERREAFLELLKRSDVEDYTVGIQSAMKQSDKEVVHYAASYITDTIAKYKEGERRMRELCGDTKNPEMILEYLHVCAGILDKRIFSEQEQCMYLDYYDMYLERLHQINRDAVDGTMLAQVIQWSNENNNSHKATKWIKYAESIMETDLEAAKIVLKDCYARKDKERFEEILNKIKHSQLLLDGETLEWIRFFA